MWWATRRRRARARSSSYEPSGSPECGGGSRCASVRNASVVCVPLTVRILRRCRKCASAPERGHRTDSPASGGSSIRWRRTTISLDSSASVSASGTISAGPRVGRRHHHDLAAPRLGRVGDGAVANDAVGAHAVDEQRHHREVQRLPPAASRPAGSPRRGRSRRRRGRGGRRAGRRRGATCARARAPRRFGEAAGREKRVFQRGPQRAGERGGPRRHVVEQRLLLRQHEEAAHLAARRG